MTCWGILKDRRTGNLAGGIDCRVGAKVYRPHTDTHPPFRAEGGYYREEAIMLLRRFYMSENQNGTHVPPSS